jgi:hypothetical protein
MPTPRTAIPAQALVLDLGSIGLSHDVLTGKTRRHIFAWSLGVEVDFIMSSLQYQQPYLPQIAGRNQNVTTGGHDVVEVVTRR